MIVCVHHTLSAASRALRLEMAEKALDFDLVSEAPWLRRVEFLRLNPAGEVPLLAEDGRVLAAGAWAAMEYVEETAPEPALLGTEPPVRAEVRRLTSWFLVKFEAEVGAPLVGEKLTKRVAGGGPPSSRAIAAGRRNIGVHLDYIAWLIDRRRWLAGEFVSLADLAAAAALSLVDYADEVPWDKHPAAKDWYARVKSRPSFRPILAERLPGIAPSAAYADLDF